MEKEHQQKLEKLLEKYNTILPNLSKKERKENREKLEKIKENFDELVDDLIDYSRKDKSEIVRKISKIVKNGGKLKGTPEEIVNKRLANKKFLEFRLDYFQKRENQTPAFNTYTAVAIPILEGEIPKNLVKYKFKWNPVSIAPEHLEAIKERGNLEELLEDSLTGKKERNNVERKIKTLIKADRANRNPFCVIAESVGEAEKELYLEKVQEVHERQEEGLDRYIT